MDPRAVRCGSWPAAVLGVTLTGVMMATAWTWWSAVLADAATLWSLSAPAPILEGTLVLVRLAAATAWALLTAILAAGTAAVFPGRRAEHDEVVRRALPPRVHALASRVATALLVATFTSPGPSSAAAGPGFVNAGSEISSTSSVGEISDARQSQDDAEEPDGHDAQGSDANCTGVGIPVPGWLPASRDHAAGADVTLVARGQHDDFLVTVRRGDTLWSIAADRLGGSATIEQVAQAWPAWYAANRDVIGPDPDLILPGQQLHPPATSREGALP
ncbi:MAG: LysM peptidoglycan-binding domain-containing protein [Actinobacteria bacterium]|nr:LysM peptidoglycan-binding domain-containing protein [Actinomycetota bacterium]